MQKNKPDHYFIPYSKINPKLIKDLNVRPESLKLPEESTGGKILDMSLGDNFWI